MENKESRIKNTPTECRLDMYYAMQRLKKMLFNTCKEQNIDTLIFNDDLIKNMGNIHIIPSYGTTMCHKLIGFEIKKERHGKMVVLLYKDTDGETRRCYDFETLNEESIWWGLSRVIDWLIYEHKNKLEDTLE